jgi:S-adenosylmethionine decarboxylase
MKGVHLVADYFGVDTGVLDNEQHLVWLMEEASKKANMTILNTQSYKFYPTGVTVLVMLAESHASIHTFPLENRCHIDLYTCGDTNTPHSALNWIKSQLNPQSTDVTILQR